MSKLQEKLDYLKEYYPEIYEELCTNVPALVEDPSSPTVEDLAEYNSYVDTIDDDDVYQLYHELID